MYVVGIASSRKQEQILLLVLTTWGTHSRLGLGWADRITTLHQLPCGDAGNSRRTYSNSKHLIQNGSARTLSCAIAAPLFLFLFFVRWVGRSSRVVSWPCARVTVPFLSLTATSPLRTAILPVPSTSMTSN